MLNLSEFQEELKSVVSKIRYETNIMNLKTPASEKF
jgi:hypothetical protein